MADHAAGDLRLEPGERFCRWLLQGAAGAAALEAAIGGALPSRLQAAAYGDQRYALWLGPDEWLLLAPAADGAIWGARLESALAGIDASLVDVSQRQTALIVEGHDAAIALNAGVPIDLDLAAFPVGKVARTIFGRIELVVWRQGVARFQLEVGRSFAPYLVEALELIQRQLAAEAALVPPVPGDLS